MCENVANGLSVSWGAVSDTRSAMGDVEYYVTVVEESDMMSNFSTNVTETTVELTYSMGLQNDTSYIIIIRGRTLSGSCEGEPANITCETAPISSLTTLPSTGWLNPNAFAMVYITSYVI